MATFPDISPDYGASKKAQPKVRNVEFGSGYSQRATFGINQTQKFGHCLGKTERRLSQIRLKIF